MSHESRIKNAEWYGAKLPRELDTSYLCAPLAEPADGDPRGGDRRRRISDRLAVDHRGDSELREAQRGARQLARVAFPLADSHVLVRTALGVAVPALRARHPGHRAAGRVAAARHRRPVVHLQDRARVAGAEGSTADARLIVAGSQGRIKTPSRARRDTSWSSERCGGRVW